MKQNKYPKEEYRKIIGIKRKAWKICIDNELDEEVLNRDPVITKHLLISLGAKPEDIILYRPEDLERWSSQTQRE